jgi:Na+/proline symporter
LYYKQLNIFSATGPDFEKILPATVYAFLPVGILGITLTGLLGAFMGTFSGTLNAAQAYIINDIYLKHINPSAANKKIAVANYIVGIAVVVIGIFLGFFAKDVNSILQWIVGGLYGGYIAANLLKWYWWRFNANGFLFGMSAGIVSALVFLKLYDGLFLNVWPIIFILSLIGCIVGTYSAPPTDTNTLISFYKTVKPWGFWKPIKDLVVAEDTNFKPNTNFRLDMFNVSVGIIAQTCLTLLPIYIVLWLKRPLLITILVLATTILILKRTWWNKLED